MRSAHTDAAPLPRGGLLDTARASLRTRPGVLLGGPAGIGKTALVSALAHDAEAEGATVLRCSPHGDERPLPYVGLIDLFATISDRRIAVLPPGPRDSLRAALLRGERPAADRGLLAIRVAVAEVLRGLALDGPLLLVLDGIQWLDLPTAEVLSYAARRSDDLGLRIAATERTGDVPALAPLAPGSTQAWHRRPRPYPSGTLELTVPPLSAHALGQLLAEERGTAAARLPSRLLRRIHQVSGGNPHYALELFRAVADGSSAEPLRVPHRLRTGLLRRLDGLSSASRAALLLAGVAAEPTLGLLRAAGVGQPVALLAEPERLGLVETRPDGTVRFRHPLLRAALLDEAGTQERLSAHAVLAAVLAEPVERARHLALAHPHEDAAVARTVAEAAASARSGGATDTAYELAALAVTRTPAAQGAERVERMLTAARYAVDAGRHEEARQAAQSVLSAPAPAPAPASDSTPDPGQRVRARLILLETAGQALGSSRGLIEAGLLDAVGEPGLEARLRFWAAVRDLLGGSTATAAAQARRAAELAAQVRDRSTGTAALGLLATVQAMRGEPADAEYTLARALRMSGGSDPLDQAAASDGLMRRQSLAELDADRVTEAHQRITALLERTREQPGLEESLATLVALVRIQVRLGEGARAMVTAERCARLLSDAGLRSPLAAYAAALAETAGGTTERAVPLARSAVDGCAADGDRLFLIRALGVLGSAQLLTGHSSGAAAAVEALQRARELGALMELADPDTVRRLADLAEALVLLGESGEATQVLAEARRLAVGWTPPWGGSAVAGLDRADGLALAALGRTEEAVAALAASADRLRELPLPLELVRTLIAWGAVERRARRRTTARALLGEAAELCRSLGAAPLLRRAEEELDRLAPGERVGTTVELTASERRVAELVANGATNREVAAVLFVSVKTVEGTLSRVYRKLGVRSRTALARAADIRGHRLFTEEARDTPLMRGARIS